MPDPITELAGHLRARFSTMPNSRTAAQLTIGLELEGFLQRIDGRPASRADEQALLRVLSGNDEPPADPLSGLEVAAASDRRCRVKLDHRPHLLELAFAPAANLHELASDLAAVLARLKLTVAALHLQVRFQAVAPWPADDPGLIDPDPRMVALREARRAWRASLHLPTDPRAENYASAIAATQLHIGGLGWWDEHGLVDRLYALEPDLIPFAAMLSVDRALLRARAELYLSSYPEAPLLLFPDFNRFSLEAWSDSLLRSPRLNGDAELKDLDELLYQARDLSWVKPRASGTLELRADPSFAGAPAILAMAALRLGLTILAWRARDMTDDLDTARRRWWRAIETWPSPDPNLVQRAREGLRQRGFGEDVYLAVFDDLKRLDL